MGKHGPDHREERIVWEEDIDGLDYVRETVATAGTRQRPVPWYGDGRRVGYAVLAPDAENDGSPGSFLRRVFFLKDYDRDSDPGGVYGRSAPSEAVDPRTVTPGVPGRLTDVAWGRPLAVEESK